MRAEQASAGRPTYLRDLICQVELIVDNFVFTHYIPVPTPRGIRPKMMRKGATFSAGDRYGTLKPDLQYRVVLLDGSDFIVEVNVSVYSFGVTDNVTSYETYAKTHEFCPGLPRWYILNVLLHV